MSFEYYWVFARSELISNEVAPELTLVLRTIYSQLQDSLPEEELSSVIQRVVDSKDLAILPFLASSSRGMQFNYSLPAYHDEVLVQSTVYFAPTVDTLILDSLNIHDDVVISISRSQSFRTVRIFSARKSRLSDRSCAKFKSFPLLEELHVTENRNITESGLVHLSECKKLRRLSISCRPEVNAIALRLLLQGNSLPALEYLDLRPQYESEPETVASALMSAIKSRLVDRGRLKRLIVGDWIDVNDVIELNRLCPNLVHSSVDEEKTISEAFLANFPPALQKSKNAEVFCFARQSILQKLLDSSPDLETLVFRSPVSVAVLPEDFSPSFFQKFSSLTFIQFVWPCALKTGFKWPPLLRKLRMTVQQESDPGAKEDFCRSLGECARGLKRLYFFSERDRLSSSHIDILLQTLPALERLTALSLLRESGPPYVVSHPTLRKYSISCDPGVDPVPGFLPGVKSLEIQSCPRDFQRLHYPSLRKLICKHFAQHDFSHMERILKDKRITELKVKSMSPAEPDSVLVFLPFSHMTVLKIPDLHLSEQTASRLIRALANLRTLAISVQISLQTDADLSWLQHRGLSSLKIAFFELKGEKQTVSDTSGPPSASFSLRLTGETLPLLCSLYLHLPPPLVPRSGVTICAFARLRRLELLKSPSSRQEKDTLRVNHCIHSCPILDVVSIQTPLSDLSLYGVPLLARLDLREELAQGATYSKFDAPSLYGVPSFLERILPAVAHFAYQPPDLLPFC